MGESVEMAAGPGTEHCHESALGQERQAADGGDPPASQLGRRDGADTPEALDLERVEELELAVGRNDEEPVGLADAARDLGEELRPRDPDRDRQSDILANRPAQASRDLGRRADASLHAVDVEKRLVDRESLHHRSGVLEEPEHRPARVCVRLHPWRHDGRVRAEAAGRSRAHGRPHPIRLGLVTRREHDTGADDHRPATEARVVPLLDRREERVEIRMQDRSIACQHEHMFAYQARAVTPGLAACSY